MIFFPITPNHPTVDSTVTRVIQTWVIAVLYWDIQKPKELYNETCTAVEIQIYPEQNHIILVSFQRFILQSLCMDIGDHTHGTHLW